MATAHMALRRKDREKAIMPRLQAELRRAKRWGEDSEARIDASERAIRDKRALRSDEEKSFADQREKVQRRRKEREEWIAQRLRTVAEPYIRIAAVLVPIR